MKLTHRAATPEDALALTRLWQQCDGVAHDPVMTDVRWLRQQLAAPDGAWYLAEGGGEPVAVVAFLTDRAHQLAKITKIYDRDGGAGKTVHDLLRFAMASLRTERAAGDVIYTTTRSLTRAQQKLTLDLDYRILGIFPNATGVDRTRLNGLTASFGPGVLGQRRYRDLTLHPTVRPFYEIVRAQCDLPDLPAADLASLPPTPSEPAPPLEMIEAPNFVHHRFRELQQRRFLNVTFYPFAEPNALITDAAQQMEVFLRVIPDMRFATILGERIEERVDPVSLYRAAADELYARGVLYIEVINDAADVAGIEAILKAGYLPNAYFPCLKNHGGMRRDYVVFGRSYEAPSLPAHHVNDVYLAYFKAYYLLHQELHFPAAARG